LANDECAMLRFGTPRIGTVSRQFIRSSCSKHEANSIGVEVRIAWSPRARCETTPGRYGSANQRIGSFRCIDAAYVALSWRPARPN